MRARSRGRLLRGRRGLLQERRPRPLRARHLAPVRGRGSERPLLRHLAVPVPAGVGAAHVQVTEAEASATRDPERELRADEGRPSLLVTLNYPVFERVQLALNDETTPVWGGVVAFIHPPLDKSMNTLNMMCHCVQRTNPV